MKVPVQMDGFGGIQGQRPHLEHSGMVQRNSIGDRSFASNNHIH